MFHEHHHKSVFPYLVVGLTLVLAFVVLWLYQPADRSGIFARPVSERSYQRSVGRILQDFDERYATANAPEAYEEVARAAATDLLNLRVPGVYRDAHLSLVVYFHRLAQSATSAQSREEILNDITSVRRQYAWMGK